jgi:hypothetical protein
MPVFAAIAAIGLRTATFDTPWGRSVMKPSHLLLAEDFSIRLTVNIAEPLRVSHKETRTHRPIRVQRKRSPAGATIDLAMCLSLGSLAFQGIKQRIVKMGRQNLVQAMHYMVFHLVAARHINAASKRRNGRHPQRVRAKFFGQLIDAQDLV